MKKTEWTEGLRTIRLLLCRNPVEAEHERALREAMLGELRADLAQLRQEGEHTKRLCALRTSRRFGPYLEQEDDGRLVLDRRAIHRAERQDGKYVLMTNDLRADAGELARGYKDLQHAERLYRTMKSLLGLRPNHHQLQERIAAHVLLSILGTVPVRLAELRTGSTAVQMERTLSPLRSVSFETDAREAVHRTKLTAEMRALYEKAAISPPEKLLRIR